VGFVLVAGSALAVGTWHPSSAPTAAQRSAAIEAAVRCPSCEGISVLDSSAATAVAIRRAVEARVRAGQSDARIEGYLTSRYGPQILLRPPAHGATAWVWVLPPLALSAGLVGIVAVLWRRRRPDAVSVSASDRALVESALAARGGLSGRGGVGTP
jgi:cytochrome c-type biogenesis protein CcmH